MEATESAVREDWIGGGLVAEPVTAREGEEALGGAAGREAAAAQAWFRAAMNAMSRPGTLHAVRSPAALPDHLPAPAAGLLLSLCDADTPVWLSPRLCRSNWAATWIGFHTGAPVVENIGEAAFAVASRADELPPFGRLRGGEPTYPDRSATLLIEVDALGEAADVAPLVLTGPGIRGEIELRVAGLPEDWLALWRDNRARFPLGIDVVLVDAERFAALPRSVRIERG